MTWNIGFMCAKCGPVQDSKKKTIAKVQYDVCKVCESVVKPWTRPRNERLGCCHICGCGSFTHRLVDRKLLRRCKNTDCQEEIEV